jgi:hypothetical protein
MRDVVQTQFCRVCVHVHKHVLFLAFQSLFHSSLPSCYFCDAKAPAFTAFVFNSFPEAFTGSGLYFKQNCQCAENGGSLEGMLIQTEISQTDTPQYLL